MRKLNHIGLLIVLLFSTIMNFGCKSKQNAVAATNDEGKKIEIETVPCEAAGRGDKDFFRVSSLANSSDLQLAKTKALLLAKQRLEEKIVAKCNLVVTRFVTEKQLTNAAEFSQFLEKMIPDVVNIALNKVVVTCDKASVLEDKKYRAFSAIELKNTEVLAGLVGQISISPKMIGDFDQQKFEEIFNQEMSKMSNE